jgi:endoglucanase
MLNIEVYLITGEKGYLNLAVSSMDYVLGRNATGYCFVTGFGTQKAMNPHHRVSFADGVVDPVPGWLIGGPNTNAQNDCGAALYPTSTYVAIAYLDNVCSYSTNEVAINWNGPLVFVTGALEALLQSIK